LVCSCSEILFNDKKKCAMKTQKRHRMLIAKWKKPGWKGCAQWGSNSMTLWKRK
jgi:hypothetical protein